MICNQPNPFSSFTEEYIMPNNDALVSVRKGGKVVLKVVVGCHISRMHEFVESIRISRQVPTLDEAVLLAARADFGCGDCLLVVDEQESSCADQTWKQFSHNEFADPNFNPRSIGGATITEIVDL
jgi:hypothetical protein